jgi:carbamoylphosphate synthase large subunit
VVRKIIEKERPDAVLPTMGGQTALNCALELERQGVLAEFGVTMIGATADAIDKAEDRRRFDVAMKKISTPRVPVSRTTWKKRWRLRLTWAIRASSVHPSPWAAPAAVSPTTAKSSKRFANAVWISRQPKSC